MSRFEFLGGGIPGIVLVSPKPIEDNRGYFMETYSKLEFAQHGINTEFVQHNQSWSKRGVLRGLHFQREPFAQAKFVRCTRGEIFDVAVDIRTHSPTFKKWFSVSLSETNRTMMFIPRGFAHGFLVVSESAEVQYLADSPYSPEHEGGVSWDDPEIGIDWPSRTPILSARDSKWPVLAALG